MFHQPAVTAENPPPPAPSIHRTNKQDESYLLCWDLNNFRFVLKQKIFRIWILIFKYDEILRSNVNAHWHVLRFNKIYFFSCPSRIWNKVIGFVCLFVHIVCEFNLLNSEIWKQFVKTVAYIKVWDPTISGMMIHLCIINLLCATGVKVSNTSSVIEHLMKLKFFISLEQAHLETAGCFFFKFNILLDMHIFSNITKNLVNVTFIF